MKDKRQRERDGIYKCFSGNRTREEAKKKAPSHSSNASLYASLKASFMKWTEHHSAIQWADLSQQHCADSYLDGS